MQSFDAEFHWSLLVKSYHLSDTSIYHWALTVHVAAVKIEMTGVALFSTILSDNSCMKVRCQKVFIYLSYLDGFYFLCFSTRLYLFWFCSCPISFLCTWMQSSVSSEQNSEKSLGSRQSNFKQLTNSFQWWMWILFCTVYIYHPKHNKMQNVIFSSRWRQSRVGPR